jgi:hypothetical protein
MVLASPPPATAAPGGCPPLGAGSSSFPATATLVLDDQGFGPPFVLRLSSAGHPDAVLQRAAQAGDVIDVQLVQLELAGFHPLLGAVTLRESLSGVSAGQIVDVTLDGTCQLAGGRARLEVQLDLEIGGVGETWIPTGPIHLEAPVGGLPPQDVRLEVPTVSPVPLEDELTGLPRGTLLYTQVHAGPPFPPPGSECFDALLTASVQLFDPPTTSSLFGFGPSRVATGPTIPGGTCNQNGQPCDADSDCQIFDTCKRSRIDTELVQLDVSGSDVHLGDWSMEVLPAIGNSDCCEAHPTGGCSDPACEQWICALDSFCCEVEWDLLCASLAETEPLCEANCLDPDANPSVGRVTSVNLDRTYPAISYFDVFLRIASETAGTLQNQAFVHLQPLAPIRNLPADPDTNWVYGGGPKTLYSASGSPVGQISNVTYTPQALYDCAPPPAAAEDCQSASLQLELTLPPCPPETLSLSGQLRTLRDAPHDGATLGQELIDAVLAQAVFAGTSSCAGPLVARLSSTAASAGTIASLTPPEFFPADASFELHLELATGAGTFTAGPATSAASVNAVPPAAGELFHGPATALPLLDGGGMPAGTFRPVTIELGGPLACTADSRSTIRFTGPSHDDFDVAVPQGGAGVDYDIVRGTLAELHAGAGSFAGAACLFADVGPSQNDAELPLPGDGFYYVSRDGLGSFNGTWNSGGPGQSADRDGLLPSCP